MNNEIELYKGLLTSIKNRVRQGQLKVNLAANAELLGTYWDIGRMIHFQQQQQKGWGKAVIPRLALDLKNELAEVKGFSVRNIQMMVQFFIEYREVVSIGKLPVAQLEDVRNTQLSVANLDNTAITQLSVAQLQDTENQAKFDCISWLDTTHYSFTKNKRPTHPLLVYAANLGTRLEP